MLKNYSFSQIVLSKYLFYFVLALNIFLLCFTSFYPSMDGAAHLYNSNILNQLIKGNVVLGEFYKINPIPVPNWTSQFILSTFHFILPAWLAEKAFLILYVVGMALSFRFLIRELSPKNISLSILIFPFIYSFLFHLGFYNFTISFILFFTTLGYWLRIQSNESIFNYFILFLLITIAYFSNVLIFGFLGLTIGLFILQFSYYFYQNTRNISSTIFFGSKKALLLFVVSIPGLTFLLIFYTSVTFFPSDQIIPAKELIKWLNDARPFIIYDYFGEEIITEQFFHVLIVLLALSFFSTKKVSLKEQFFNINRVDIISIPLIILAILLFITPTGSNAGMMSDRYCLMIYIFGLIWVVSRSIPSKFNSIIVFFVLIFHFGLLFKHLNGTIRKLDTNAVSISKAESYIINNSIVLPVNLSDNWIEPHFSNYLGVDKPMIILENYEASVGWFPIKWNSENMPKVLLGDKNSISGIQWITNLNSKKIRQINTILLYGNTSRLNDPKWEELREILSSNFKLKYNSENNYVMIYEKIQ